VEVLSAWTGTPRGTLAVDEMFARYLVVFTGMESALWRFFQVFFAQDGRPAYDKVVEPFLSTLTYRGIRFGLF
jgi:hypothetical protein